jgi:hypothetical protein
MSRILVPSNGPSDWRRLLADPAVQWRAGKSAFESAVAWKTAKATERGLPDSIARLLDTNETSANAEVLIAAPELRVNLPGGGHPSQNDVWALLRARAGLCSLCVEAKSGETLGPLVREWLPTADDTTPSGKPKRLDFVRKCLGLEGADLGDLRYQLLHRAASAILMGERFGATSAVLLIHSFGATARDDYRRFAELMGCTMIGDALGAVRRTTRLPLLLGWVTDTPAAPDVANRRTRMALSDSEIARLVRSAGTALQKAGARRESGEDWCSDRIAPAWQSATFNTAVRQPYPGGGHENDLEIRYAGELVSVFEAKRWSGDQQILDAAAKLREGYGPTVHKLLLLTGCYDTDAPDITQWLAGPNVAGLNGRWRGEWLHCFRVANADAGRYENFFYTVSVQLM